MTAKSREFDVVVWGATGFTGQLVAEYLQHHCGATDLRFALAGRSADKLQAVSEKIGCTAPHIVADSNDIDSLNAMAARTHVVCTTVGPYARYGSQLVSACVAAGTHYCDLAGEVPWIRKMIDTHHDKARASGARIVHCCGFDSIPSDLGTLFLQNAASAEFGVPCVDVKFRLKAASGSASGGTAASLMGVVKAARDDREVARIVANPYSLCPKGERSGPDKRDQAGPAFDADVDAWTGPFVMAAINTKVVRRSNALLGYPWGRDFRYSEAVITGRGLAGRLKATALTAGFGALMLTAALKPGRALLNRLVLPKPGDGPDAEARERGFFNIILIGTTADGRQLRAKVTADRDPGYGATCGMLAESALELAAQAERGEGDGGVMTPASALGLEMIERLTSRAGMTFELT